jgi:hypothetical protein
MQGIGAGAVTRRLSFAAPVVAIIGMRLDSPGGTYKPPEVGKLGGKNDCQIKAPPSVGLHVFGLIAYSAPLSI